MRDAFKVGTVGAILVVAGAAHGQYPKAEIAFTIEWERTVIAPGESNAATVRATLWPDIGATVTWHRSGTGTGVPGTLKSFANAIFSLKNVSNGLSGEIVNAKVPDEFVNSPNPITPDGNGGLNVQAGQQQFPFNPNPNVGQSVVVLTFEWLAKGAGQWYDVMYAIKSTSGKVFLDVGLTPWVGENATRFDGQGGFTVTPAPPATLLLALGAVVCTHRRRLA